MREWVITNGIGGYAASTDFGGMNTRKYHGLLVASLNPPGKRRLIQIIMHYIQMTLVELLQMDMIIKQNSKKAAM